MNSALLADAASGRQGGNKVRGAAVKVGAAALLAFVSPFLLSSDPYSQSLLTAFQPPSADYILGADHLGRSVLVRLVHGAQISLGLAVVGVFAATSIGVVVGLTAVWCGGLLDIAIMRAADVIMACPTLLSVLLVAGLFGGGIGPVLAGLCLAQWPIFARLAHAIGRSELVSDHVEAAHLLGFSSWYVLTRHVLPGIAPHIASTAALSLATNILAISSVGFVGIGLAPSTPEWGTMVADALSYLRDAPHMVIAPALAIFVSTFAATLIGEALAVEQNGVIEEAE